mmetsp:Transcript_41811/g.122314  ORF Transcript_41811/g.122314 Transcript_41811/m.122314 type:complete len:176 (+) Transcript_41811:1927-2454(+)
MTVPTRRAMKVNAVISTPAVTSNTNTAAGAACALRATAFGSSTSTTSEAGDPCGMPTFRPRITDAVEWAAGVDAGLVGCGFDGAPKTDVALTADAADAVDTDPGGDGGGGGGEVEGLGGGGGGGGGDGPGGTDGDGGMGCGGGKKGGGETGGFGGEFGLNTCVEHLTRTFFQSDT